MAIGRIFFIHLHYSVSESVSVLIKHGIFGKKIDIDKQRRSCFKTSPKICKKFLIAGEEISSTLIQDEENTNIGLKIQGINDHFAPTKNLSEMKKILLN